MGQNMKPLHSGLDDMSTASGNGAHFIDKLIALLGLKNDAALARLLEVGPPVVSKIRNDKLPISPALLVRCHDATGFTIAALRSIARGGK